MYKKLKHGEKSNIIVTEIYTFDMPHKRVSYTSSYYDLKWLFIVPR